MAFLQSGAIVFPVSTFRRLPDEYGGTLNRMLGGQLRGAANWTARAWEAEVVCPTDVDANNVHGIANPFSDASFSGDGLGATITVRVEVTGDDWQHTGEDGAWFRVLKLTLREQVT